MVMGKRGPDERDWEMLLLLLLFVFKEIRILIWIKVTWIQVNLFAGQWEWYREWGSLGDGENGQTEFRERHY